MGTEKNTAISWHQKGEGTCCKLDYVESIITRLLSEYLSWGFRSSDVQHQ